MTRCVQQCSLVSVRTIAKLTLAADVGLTYEHDACIPCQDLEEQQHIFMRWKEQFFCGRSTAEECGLTIAGAAFTLVYTQCRTVVPQLLAVTRTCGNL